MQYDYNNLPDYVRRALLLSFAYRVAAAKEAK